MSEQLPKAGKSGFERLKSAAALASIGFGALFMPGTGRAGTFTLSGQVSATRLNRTQIFNSTTGGPVHSMQWLDVGNRPTLPTASVPYTATTTKITTLRDSAVNTHVNVNTHTSTTFTFTSTFDWTFFTATTPSPAPPPGFTYVYCTEIGEDQYSCSASYWTSTFTTFTYTYYTTTTTTTTSYSNTRLVRVTNPGVTINTDTTIDGPMEVGGAQYNEPGTMDPTRPAIFDGILAFDVDGNDFINPMGYVDFDDNTVTSQTMVDIVAGIDAQVEFFFSPEKPFVRAMYTLTNTTDADIQAELGVNGQLAYGMNTTVQDTSSGDATADNSDEWVAVNDSGALDTDGAGHVVIISRYGAGASVQPTDVESLGTGSAGNFEQIYDITVPAGGAARVLVFAMVATDLAEAEALPKDPAANKAVLLEGLTDAEVKAVVNYEISDSSEGGLRALAAAGGSGGGSLGWAALLGGLGLALRRRRSDRP